MSKKYLRRKDGSHFDLDQQRDHTGRFIKPRYNPGKQERAYLMRQLGLTIAEFDNSLYEYNIELNEKIKRSEFTEAELKNWLNDTWSVEKGCWIKSDGSDR